jgi:small-conductance mechanosensitive channel
MEKSANKSYKESNTTLSFKQWIQREKEKGIFIPNKLFSNIANESNEKNFLNKSIANIPSETNLEPKKRIDETFLGINKWVVIGGSTLILFGLVYKFYGKKQ